MILGLLGKKLRMTQIFMEDGKLVPVTAVQAGPCFVLQIRTPEKEGYRAIQLGFQEKKKKRCKKPQLKFFEKIEVPPQAFIREIPYGTDELLNHIQVGQKIGVEIFEGVKKVDVIGRSKGRGFAGCIKRHGFSRGPMTHGCKNIREPGSTGQCATPGKTFKGKKMAGHYGASRVTVRNLEIVKTLPDDNILLLKGAVPGPNGGFIIIQKSIEERNKWGLSSGKKAFQAAG
ncbi:MAG: 50S ribosomal protein L3 [Planctomycetota bacterium]|nr:MAG: 50S ribosomal protein L3 [Planctomycetota bacterium]